MSIWTKSEININGQIVEAIEPVIISASRATDIPAFFGEQFVENLSKGYTCWTNPFNQKKSFISFSKTKLIVFWTKNPKKFIPFLKIIDELKIDYFFHFTINDYEKESFEPNIPSLKERISTFIELSKLIGKDRIIWRYDPLVLNKFISINDLVKRIENIGNELIEYTNKYIFSFVDIHEYTKIKRRFLNSKIEIREFENAEKEEFAQRISKIYSNWLNQNTNFQIASCAESINLEKYKIQHNKCIDNEYIVKQFSNNKELVDFVQKNGKKDKNQRNDCNCIVSKDIGKYNTCTHNCVYCYAIK